MFGFGEPIKMTLALQVTRRSPSHQCSGESRAHPFRETEGSATPLAADRKLVSAQKAV